MSQWRFFERGENRLPRKQGKIFDKKVTKQEKSFWALWLGKLMYFFHGKKSEE